MKTREIQSYDELMQAVKDKQRSYLLLYKKGSDLSECSLRNLSEVRSEGNEIELMMADVSQVKDIHSKFQITSVPVMLEFEMGRFVNVLKGCHEPGFYKSFFENALFTAKSAEGETPQKRVTVYSTPSCSWCTTLKTHLKKHGIRYRDIDVSRDEQAARDMQRKSGQMGVPQTEIDGQIIVGFDKARINALLGING